MKTPNPIPLATILGWAKEAGLDADSVVVMGRAAGGRFEVAHASEDGRAIVAMLREAADAIEARLAKGKSCDARHLEGVRSETENGPSSHGAAA